MADFTTRLREVITLTSPSGLEFTASWIGNPVNMTNKVGIHEIPGVSGARVQDQKSGARIWPLTFSFTGPDNDKNATNFSNTLQAESGPWTIIHPVKGPKLLVWTEASEDVQPVTSANVTTFTTSWVEDTEDSKIESAAQIQNAAEVQAAQANAKAAEQFSATALQTTAAEKQSIIGTVGKLITKAKKFLKLVENYEIIDPQLTAILGAITNTLSGDIIDTSVLAGQVQTYIQLFGLGQISATDSVQMYSDFSDEVLTIVPEQANSEGISTMATTELFAGAALVGAGQGALIGGITSRPQAITTAQILAGLFEKVTNELDAIGALYTDNPIDTRYFSQSESYADALLLAKKSSRFLFNSIFGLPAERRTVLKQDKVLAQIAFDEYGAIGNAESETYYIDKLIESNGLCGDDLYFLRAGRQVLIYAEG